jgi:hypothetical protein
MLKFNQKIALVTEHHTYQKLCFFQCKHHIYNMPSEFTRVYVTIPPSYNRLNTIPLLGYMQASMKETLGLRICAGNTKHDENPSNSTTSGRAEVENFDFSHTTAHNWDARGNDIS